MNRLIASFVLLTFATPAFAQQADSAAVISVINRFHEALAAGDSTAALSLLSDDVIVLEAGGVETREEYRSHHLPGDIGFAKAIQSERKVVSVKVRGDVLTKTPSGWRISAIHWSSRRRS